MKRILLALNPKRINNVALDFGCYLGKLTQSKISGVFLEANPGAVQSRSSLQDQLKTYTQQERESGDFTRVLTHFGEACLSRDTGYSVGRGKCIDLEGLIEESRFADLMVIDPCISFKDETVSAPSPLARQILSNAACPVVLAPELFDGIQMIVMTYDGSKAATHAIKQFTYLFPEFRDHKIQLVQVEHERERHPDELLFTEWLNCHYPHLKYIVLKGNSEDRLINYLLPLNNTLVVMGAYGRNFISRFFRQSMAEALVGTVVNPIFTAH